ncbi:MAG: OadG family protein [Elusimicrobiaceae bacterium]|nr:OadG family protein [Elusimicrobiaceae bacterium]
MSESLFAQSINITIIGMLVVFVFLVILIAMMKLLGVTVQAMEKYFPQTVPAAQDNALIAVAIAAARKFQGK